MLCCGHSSASQSHRGIIIVGFPSLHTKVLEAILQVDEQQRGLLIDVVIKQRC